MPSDVIQMVQQHHENCAGTGYPMGFKRNRIHPLARLISLADEFCNLVLKNPNGDPIPAIAGSSLRPH